jgi:hypothetical protein
MIFCCLDSLKKEVTDAIVSLLNFLGHQGLRVSKTQTAVCRGRGKIFGTPSQQRKRQTEL